MMNQDHFDWAALAQQWIQKNSCIPNNSDIPEPPPPPIISANVSHIPTAHNVQRQFEEQGEADMEVVDDDEHIQQQQQQNFLQIGSAGIIQQQQQQFSSGSAVPSAVWFGPPQNQQIPYLGNPWNQWQTPGNVPLPPPQLHIPPVQHINIVRDNQILPIPPLLKTPGTQTEETPPVIDAAKRKTLPAWIREGLEKMEREKLKQMEKLKSTSDNPEIKIKSQWSDDDDNDNVVYKDGTTVGSKPIKSSFDIKNFVKSSPADSESENSADDDIRPSFQKLSDKEEKQLSPVHIKKPLKSYDEIVEELMLVVRRSLTEILLEVTTEEIHSISQETFKKHKLKASSAQVFRKSAISSITGKLGLGAYADSASSDDSQSDNSDDENGKNSDEEKDSEDEIREIIRNRQNSFKAIAQEIDSLATQEEARKEQKTREKRSVERSHSTKNNNSSNNGATSSSTSRKYGTDKDFGETQHTDKKSLSNGKRPKERTSRFSDNKDSRHKSASSSSHYLVPTSASIIPANAPTPPPFLITSQAKGTNSQNISDYDEKLQNSYSKKQRSISSSSSSSTNESKSSSRNKRSARHHHKKSSRDSKDSKSSSYYKKYDSNSRSRKHKDYGGNSSDSDDYRRRRSCSSSRTKSRRNKSRSRSRSKSRSRSRYSSTSSRRYERY